MGSLSRRYRRLGFHVEVGFEYKLVTRKTSAIGASVGTYGSRFSALDDACRRNNNDDLRNGISRISLNESGPAFFIFSGKSHYGT